MSAASLVARMDRAPTDGFLFTTRRLAGWSAALRAKREAHATAARRALEKRARACGRAHTRWAREGRDEGKKAVATATKSPGGTRDGCHGSRERNGPDMPSGRYRHN